MKSQLAILATLTALSSLVLASCNADVNITTSNNSPGGGSSAGGGDTAPEVIPTVTSAQLANDVLTLSGTDLNAVTALEIQGSPSRTLVIQSKSSSNLTAVVLSTTQLALDTAYELLVSTAHATTQVPFTITGTTANISDFSTAVSGAITGANLVGKSLYSSKGNILVATASSTPAALSLGSDGQVLTADSSQASGVKWASQTSENISDFSTAVSTAVNSAITGANLVAKSSYSSKGDILAATGSGTPTALPAGTDGQVLTADSSQASGVKWATASGGGGGSSAPISKLSYYYNPGGVRTKLAEVIGFNNSLFRFIGMTAGYAFVINSNFLSANLTNLPGSFLLGTTLSFSEAGCTGNIATTGTSGFAGYVQRNAISGGDPTLAFYYIPANASPLTSGFAYVSQMTTGGVCNTNSGTLTAGGNAVFAVTRDTATASTAGALGITTALFQTGALTSNPLYVVIEQE